jgi:hypothetical protein
MRLNRHFNRQGLGSRHRMESEGNCMLRVSSRVLCLGLFFAVFATACDEATAPEGDAPELPPQASLVIDFSDFLNPALAASAVNQTAPAAGTYWTRAAVVAGVWNFIITGTLAPPVAAFVAAAHQAPEWSGEAWTWSYNFNALTVQHSARLEARMIPDGVQWDMYITRDGSFDDFHWYSGFSHQSGTSGTWSLNRTPDDATAFIDIEWNRSASGDTYDITYTNVVAGAAENGSYITYGVTGNTPYDAYYDLFGAQGNNLTEIQWNRTTKEGRTADPAHFQDSNWRCWNANLDNTSCQ